jgi:hypothetical protein
VNCLGIRFATGDLPRRLTNHDHVNQGPGAITGSKRNRRETHRLWAGARQNMAVLIDLDEAVGYRTVGKTEAIAGDKIGPIHWR